MNRPDTFWARLRQRKIVQWTVAYVAGTVVLLEFSDYVRSAFGLSQAGMTVLTVLVAFGFLAMLVLAWYHGKSGSQRVHSTELILLAAIAVTAGITAWQLGTQAAQRSARFRGAGRSAIGPAAIDSLRLSRSIAVLPFDNLSADAENDYFSDGITADIIAALGQNLRDVRVISRTSVMPYRDVADRSVRQIARELNVRYVVEGSVQRTDDRVRINATLIDVDADDDIWTYQQDYALEDILAIQSEVSHQVARALQVEFDPEFIAMADSATPQIDPRSNDLYYEGMKLEGSDDPADRSRAADLYEQAIEIDSSHTSAWAGLLRVSVSSEMDPVQMVAAPDNERADSVIQRGLSRRPDAPEVQMYALRRDFQRGDASMPLDSIERIVEANRNRADLRHLYGVRLAMEGHYLEALEQLDEAQAIEPTSVRIGSTIGEVLYAMGRHQEAVEKLRDALARDPDRASTRTALGLAFHALGATDSALVHLREAERATRESDAHVVYVGMLGQVLAQTGRTDEATAMLDSLTVRAERGRGGRDAPLAIAQILVGFERNEEALDWLERDRTCSPARFSPRVLRSLEPLRDDPRFRDWLRRDCRGRGGRDGRGRGGRGGRGG